MELLAFAGVPGHVWTSTLTAAGLGIIFLAIAQRILKHSFWRELVRDVGIAFIVAGIVSIVYEYSTRSIEKRETVTKTLNRAMSLFVPEDFWNEVEDQILRRRALRRNVQIEIAISREAKIDGRTVTAPPGQAVLWMSYSYDLYGLTAGESRIAVEHELDYAMFNPDLQLPRFERIAVIGPDATRVYDGAKLAKILDGNGKVNLEGANSIRLPPPESRQPVRIITERYELVNTPGSYYLIFPELTAKQEEGVEPTIKVAITEHPADVEPNVTTYYPSHDFVRPDAKANVWIFDKTLLPGQGLTVVFKRTAV